MRILVSFCLAFIISQSSLIDGYRILGLFPLAGKSHWVMMEALMIGLAERGHQVDVLTQFKIKNPHPNYNEILLKNEVGSPVNNVTAHDTKRFSSLNMEHLTYIAGYKICMLMEQPPIKSIITNPPKDPPYDLVIIELFAAHCYLAFGRHLKVPVVGVMSSPFHDWSSHWIGVPNEGAYVPNIFSGFSQKMSFVERLTNTFMIHFLQLQMNYHVNKQNEITKQYFGIDATTSDLFQDLSLVLVNSHHSLHGIRSFPHSVIEVGGLHLSNNNTDPLQPEVQKWLDDSKDGCVYFTFGSMVRIETFPKEMIEMFYKSFEKIAPTRVLMKVAKKEELLPGLPKNVMTQSWFSQIPVLKHKNTKAFITHGGLMGTTESIFYGIPMIGIPLFGDQSVNIQNYVNRKVAISLGSIYELTEEKLTNALKTILNDPSYMTNIKKLSETFKDRPEPVMTKATYWVEYVIKHKNLLQSPAIFLPWWQRYLFDVYGTIILVLILVTLLAIYLIKLIVKFVFGKNRQKVEKNLKKKKN